MEALKNLTHKDKVTYSTLIILSIIFVGLDIYFKCIDSFEGASITSIIGTVIIAIGTYKSRLFQIKKVEEQSLKYIKKNFDIYNIILSVLDIVCSFVVILASFVFVGYLSNIVLAGRILFLIIKFKDVSFAILGFCIIHLIGKIIKTDKRGKKKMADENVTVEATATTVKTTKISLPQWATIIVAILGSAYGVACYFVPDIVIFGDQIISMLSGFGITTVSAIVGVFTTYATKSNEELAKAVEKQNAKIEAKTVKENSSYIEQATTQLAEKQQAEIQALAEQLKSGTTTTETVVATESTTTQV